MKFPDDFINKIICGDCIETMKAMKPNSIDAVVTDPPYGLEFMGKEWDRLVDKRPAYNEKIAKHKDNGRHGGGNNPYVQSRITYKAGLQAQLWHSQWLTEAYRVLKPGGSMLVMGGTRTFHRLACAIEDSGFIIKDTLMWLYGSGFPKAQDLGKMIDKRNGDGKKWNGFKIGGIKPAYEPIVWAVKPPWGSYVDNVLKWGVGAVNVDECRIEVGIDEPNKRNDTGGYKSGQSQATVPNAPYNHTRSATLTQGRFPANVILDEEAGRMLDEQSGSAGQKVKPGYIRKSPKTKNAYGKYQFLNDEIEYGDSGGASRFFYCTKASKSERGNGNNHPTVKPIALFKYLIKLITREGQAVLDPFFGSGTMGLACNQSGRKYIGIEREPDYCKIAEERLAQGVL